MDKTCGTVCGPLAERLGWVEDGETAPYGLAGLIATVVDGGTRQSDPRAVLAPACQHLWPVLDDGPLTTDVHSRSACHPLLGRLRIGAPRLRPLSPKLRTSDYSSARPGSSTWVNKVPSQDTPSLNLAGGWRGVGSQQPSGHTPPVGDMDGIGRAAPATVGVGRTPVTGDHLHTGVGLQPGCEAVRLAVARGGLARAGPSAGGGSCCAAAMMGGRNQDRVVRLCGIGTRR